MKIAFVFCADKRFKVGLNLLYKTLIKNNPNIINNDFILLTNDILKYKNFKIIDCSEIEIDTHIDRFSKTFYKLKIFSLEEYDRIIFIDSDVVCLGDISFLTSEEISDCYICAAKDEGIILNKNINTGVMVINKPLLSNSVYLEMISIAKRGFNQSLSDSKGNGSDQTVINHYLEINNINCYHLDIRYNTLKRIFHYHKNIWKTINQDIRLLHFVGEKPWKIKKEYKDYKELNDLWKSLYYKNVFKFI